MPSVAKQWAVTTNGTFDFNDPANWQFGIVPGILDAAAFNTNVNDTVTGSATIAELQIDLGLITLTGSYTLSGAQPTELSTGVDGGLIIAAGASVSGAGSISVFGELIVEGALSGSSMAISGVPAFLTLSPGSILDVGSISLGVGGFIARDGATEIGIGTGNPLQISGAVSQLASELLITGTVSGTGLLQVFGSVELDGSNTYSGGATLSPSGLAGSVLAVGNANALGTGGLTITNGGELLGTTTEAIPNALTINGNAAIAAPHGQTLTVSSWTINANGQTLTFGAPGQDGTVAMPGAVINNVASGYTILVQSGTLQENASSFGSGVTANDDHTTIQSGATFDVFGFPTTLNDLQGGGSITDTSFFAAPLTVFGGAFGGVISGPLSLEASGPAQLVLSGNNTYAGTTTIDSGATLILGNGGTAGSVAGAIADNGVLGIDHSDSFVVNNVSGSGLLRQIGSGVTTLGTGLSYTGGTQISGGTLVVNDPTALGAGGVTTSGGGLLAGATETIHNILTMNGDFRVAAALGQTLTMASWDVAANGQTIAFGGPGQNGTVVWGAAGLEMVSNPANGYTILVQAGTLRAGDSNFTILASNDTTTLIRPAGTLDANGFSFTVNDLHGGGQIIDSGGAATLMVNGGSFSGVISGPLSLSVTNNSSLSLSGNNTYTGTTTINSGSSLTLGAGGTTGSVSGAITDNGILAINRSDNFIVNNVSGSGQLQQTGPGNTWLGTGLSYSGGTSISAGTLIVNDPAALGTGGLTIEGGELAAGLTETIQNGLTLSGDFTIAAAHGQTLTTSNTHIGSLTASGQTITFGAPGQDGTVAWTADAVAVIGNPLNGYTILVRAGTLRTNDSGSNFFISNDTQTVIRPAGTLDVAGQAITVNDLRGGGHVTDSGAAATLTVNGGNFSGVIDGPLSLDVISALMLSGTNTYSGSTTIHPGVALTLGAGGTTGSVPGAITDNGTLEFRHSNTFVEAGTISGSGRVLQDGAGTTVLTAINSYSGTTFLGGGTLEAQTSGALGSGAVTFLAGAPSTLRIDGLTMPGNTILNFALGDTIDLHNIAANGWSYAGGVLHLLNSGAPVAQLNLGTSFAHPLFALSGDGGGGTNIVLEPPPPQDLNADNLADLVFQTPNNAFLGAVSTGAGFTAPQLWVQHGGSFMAGEAQYADLNNDRRADLIFQGSDNRFYVSLSTGSGFTAPVQWVQHGGSFVAGQAQYADVNADGRADLILQSSDDGFYVSLSTGSSFTPPALWVQHGGSFTAGEAQYDDVNGDGRADLIFQSNDNRFFVSLSTGSGFSAPVQWVQHGGTFTAGQAQYADVNGDGLADLIMQGSDNRFFVSTSTGSGFTAPVQWMQHGGSFTPGQAQYADVNGDHLADLIFQSNDNRFFVSLSTGSGFTAPVQWMMHGGSFTPGQAQYADVNGDGQYDLLFQGNDNKEFLSVSSGSSFGAPSLAADFGAYGPFQPGTLHV